MEGFHCYGSYKIYKTALVVVFLNEYIEVQCSFLFINYKPNWEPGILLLEVWLYHNLYLFRISEIELLFNYNTCNSGIRNSSIIKLSGL